jgi:hypothetical protein
MRGQAVWYCFSIFRLVLVRLFGFMRQSGNQCVCPGWHFEEGDLCKVIRGGTVYQELLEAEAENRKAIEDIIEEERRKVDAKTPITEEVSNDGPYMPVLCRGNRVTSMAFGGSVRPSQRLHNR